MPGSVSHIPNFIEARSAKALRVLMFKTNLGAGKEFRFFDISFVPDDVKGGSWIAWYYDQANPQIEGENGLKVTPRQG